MLRDSSASIDDPSIVPYDAPMEWMELDRRLRDYGRQRSALDAAESFDLVRAEDIRVYLNFGCAHHYEYMERVFGLGPHAARERMRVARALVSLPATGMKLATGELTFSAVRELTRVAIPDTEAAWLAAMEGKSLCEVEELVAGHVRGDLPDDPTTPDLRPRKLGLELPPEVYALWRQARAALATERGSEITEADFVETMCRRVLEPGSGAEGPAQQIAYKQCPDCKRVTQNGAGREIEVSAEVFERAACDATRLGSLDAAVPARATTTVTPRIREQIFARDGHLCRVPGCRSARNLTIHHIIEQAAGGPHALWNLILLCSGHHAALHARLLSVTGRAPYDVHFRWIYAPPIPAGLDPESRARARREQGAAVMQSLAEAPPASDDSWMERIERRHLTPPRRARARAAR